MRSRTRVRSWYLGPPSPPRATRESRLHAAAVTDVERWHGPRLGVASLLNEDNRRRPLPDLAVLEGPLGRFLLGVGGGVVVQEIKGPLHVH